MDKQNFPNIYFRDFELSKKNLNQEVLCFYLLFKMVKKIFSQLSIKLSS